MFKKDDKVVKIFRTPNTETACLAVIGKTTSKFVRCVSDESLKYDPVTGQELDVAPGFAAYGISSRLIHLEE